MGSAFTSVGGHGRGFGGHEAILQNFHSTYLQHGMVRLEQSSCQLALCGTALCVCMQGCSAADASVKAHEACTT